MYLNSSDSTTRTRTTTEVLYVRPLIYLIHSYFYLRALVAEAKEISHFVAKLNEDNKNSVNEDDIIDTKEWTR